MILHLTSENFKEQTKSEKPILVDFWAPWCGPCRMVAPVLEELDKLSGDNFRIGKINVDEQPALASQFGVMSIPTIIVFKNGQVLAKSVGLRSKEELLKMLV